MNKGKKNIVIVTWCSANYGTVLQAFALVKFIRDHNYNVSLISSFPRCYSFRLVLLRLMEILGLKMLYFRLRGGVISHRDRLMNIFISENLPLIKLFYKGQLERITKRTDIFLSGSDQIWNSYHRYDSNFFLSFANNVKKVAYSSSIGTDNVNPQYSDEIRIHLKDFYSIGVREKTAVSVLEKLTGRNDICRVLDPVFLLEKEQWLKLSISTLLRELTSKSYMLCYCVGENTFYPEQIRNVANAYNIKKIFIIPSFESPNFFKSFDEFSILDQVGPADFVHLISNAQLVCTDSFHASALSIRFNKDFVVLRRFDDDDKKSQNSRIYDLLNLFNLKTRLYSVDNSDWKQVINYQDINKILESELNQSETYLLKSIL